MIKRTLKWLAAILGVVVLAGAIFLVNLIWFRPWSLDLFYEKIFAEVLFDDPELLSSLGIAERFGITGHNGKLTDASPEYEAKLFERARRDLDELHQYPFDRQTPSQRVSTRIVEWYLEQTVEGEKYRFHNYPVNQLFGVQNQFPSFMANIHRLQQRRDCDYYVARLAALPAKFDQVLAGLQLRESKGIVPPRFLVEKVLQEMEAFVGKPTSENILATSFKKRSAMIADFTDDERAAYQARVEQAIEQSVYPAYRRLIAHFRDLLPRTTTDDGVWKLPDGAAFYAYMLHQNTTLPLSADEVHELGLREVARIEREMRTILEANGFEGKAIQDAMEALAIDPRFLFANDDRGRSDALDEYKRLITDAIERSQRLFVKTPRAKLDVRRVPEFKEATAPGAYYDGPALDGSRPGVFFANLRDMSALPRWSMRTLAYHEGVPGHHWQISTAQELTDVPQFRKVIPFTAYLEGWALYSEWLAHDAHWYDGDSFGELGRLQAELFRAVRLVVDTGIHAKRWTRERAIDYMQEKTGMRRGEVTAEIERYIVNPGQACAYKIGMIKIQELRRHAEAALGTKFDVREFHDAVLRDGALPLSLLEQQIDAYIESRKQ
jgi:uncharacterized protein (DUF885 family)